MGFSPETTVQTALILRPKRLIIACSSNAHAPAEPAILYLFNERIISPAHYHMLTIDPFSPVDIYDQIMAVLPNYKRMMFDITGGTKIMSATAGALAWERNLSFCYLNGIWDPQKGAAGLKDASRLIVVPNPSRSRGYRYRKDALRNYQLGYFIQARERFDESRKLIDDSSLDQLGYQLCLCYAALTDFDRKGMRRRLKELEVILSFGDVRKLYKNRLDFTSHLTALSQFAEDPINLIAVSAASMELADLYRKRGRFDFAGLMSYRSMERFVEIGLKELAGEKFKMNKPDWKLLTDDEEQLQTEFAKLSLSGKDSLPTKVSFISGFSILSIFDDTLGTRFAKAKNKNAIGMLMGLAELRNRSYLAHGFENLNEDDSLTLREAAQKLAKAVLKDQYDEYASMCERIRPLDLHKL